MTFSTEEDARFFIALVVPNTDAVVVPTTHGYFAVTSHKKANLPAKVCSICGQLFHESANNARPVKDGGCCAYCDDHVVTPTRIAMVLGKAV